MKNSSYYMAIVMMAFLFSCGKPKEENNNDNGGVRLFETISVSKLKPMLDDELVRINQACSSLSVKEENLKLMANQTKFNFESQVQICGSSSSQKGSATAYVRHQASNLYFEKSSGNGVIFTDVILRGSSDMMEFCDKAQSNGLSSRALISGNKVKIIATQPTAGGIQIVISTGFLNKDSDYDIKLTDEYIVLVNNSASNGFVSKRLMRNGMICDGNKVYSKYVELK